MTKQEFIGAINAVADAMDEETQGIRESGLEWLAERLARQNGCRVQVLAEVVEFVKRNGMPE